MLIVSHLTADLTVNDLAKIWARRYSPEVNHIGQYSSTVRKVVVSNMLERTNSLEGRRATVEKLHRSLIKLHCELAETQSCEFYGYSSSEISSDESRGIVQCAVEIYVTLLDFYQQSLPSSAKEPQEGNSDDYSSLARLEVPDIIELANLLDPLLLEYQRRHQISDDWAKIGFLTTHLNFSNVALLENLTTVEQLLIKPYFKFLEEYVALPWHRVCAAARVHQYNSPAFEVVSYLLPEAEDIAYRAYMNLLKQFPKMPMRRGRLDHPGVRHSCLRDLNMFQAYLWLCVLQGSLDPVEDELVRLCAMVMPRVGVPWEMTNLGNELLMKEIMSRTLLRYQTFLKPYMIKFVQIFHQSKDQFSA